MNRVDTICALATVHGAGAIAVIRISGENAIDIVNSIFTPFKGVLFSETPSSTVRYGGIYRSGRVEQKEYLDEVLVTVFRSPYSFTGENSVEISCHGSTYIQKEILNLLINNGARLARPGEFTQRAFLNGKMDLSQAEAVADLIASENSAAHRIALKQMRGGFSNELMSMRSSLLELASLMELELDFSEEDVEFADRKKLIELLSEIQLKIHNLTESFKLGNVIKNGVPVSIVGATNTGKSTLLNLILGEERAIVSNIHGTTRDFIEDTANIDGITFRFTDTAGIRETTEPIEMMGIERTYCKIRESSIVILVLDSERPDSFEPSIKQIASAIGNGEQQVIILINKIDLLMNVIDTNHLYGVTSYGTLYDDFSNDSIQDRYLNKYLADTSDAVFNISQKAKLNTIAILPFSALRLLEIEQLKKILIDTQSDRIYDINAILINNSRHYEALTASYKALERVAGGIESGLPTDLLTQDIREALYHIGEITGQISSDEILKTIFGKFCIGK